jgi:hypothetical protein
VQYAGRALSVRQPYAWLIVYGFEPIENRTWRTTSCSMAGEHHLDHQ